MMNKRVPLFYHLGKLIIIPLFKLYYNPKIVNKEYIPKKGPIVIAGNHKHLYDQFLVIGATNRGIHYMAKKEYFDNKKTKWFFKSAGCISVDRKNHDTNAKNMALDVLKDNGAIGIFPEGTRNKTEEILLPFKYGAISMASKTNSTIVPFAITGDYKFRSKNLKITFLEPFKVDKMSKEEANNKLYSIIKEQLIKEI